MRAEVEASSYLLLPPAIKQSISKQGHKDKLATNTALIAEQKRVASSKTFEVLKIDKAHVANNILSRAREVKLTEYTKRADAVKHYAPGQQTRIEADKFSIDFKEKCELFLKK